MVQSNNGKFDDLKLNWEKRKFEWIGFVILLLYTIKRNPSVGEHDWQPYT